MTQPPRTESERTDTTSVTRVIAASAKDLGEMTVRRILPAPLQRTIGPFVFLDHMGPADFAPGEGIQVRPHPHIGLATITYLLEGEIMHRDNIGVVQAIKPGAVNLMVAGRGIVHSERSGDDLNQQSRLHGIQSWLALPDTDEECEPDFSHYHAHAIPELVLNDECRVRIIMGNAYGERSPVRSFSPTLYLACEMPQGARITLPQEYEERAVYVISGSVALDKQTYNEGTMLVTRPDATITLTAMHATQFIVLGGSHVGPRHLWWNFVSSRKARIEQAKRDWRDQRFDSIDGDNEFIPLPD